MSCFFCCLSSSVAPEEEDGLYSDPIFLSDEEEVTQLVLALPLGLRQPFDDFLTTSLAFASARESVALVDALELAWGDLVEQRSHNIRDASASKSPIDLDMWKTMENSFNKFRQRNDYGADQISEHLKGAKSEFRWLATWHFDTDLAFSHIECAKDVIVRMLTLYPFPQFVLSEHCERLVASLRGVGPLPDKLSLAISNRGRRGSLPSRDRTGDRLAGLLEAARVKGSHTQVPVANPKDWQAVSAHRRKELLDKFSRVAETLPSMVCVSDYLARDCPVVYVNPLFEKVTGYLLSEIKGKNCRFLQGKETDKGTVALMRKALSEHQTFHSDILNFTVEGLPFRNFLTFKPVWENLPSGDKRVCFYLAVQFDAQVLRKKGGMKRSAVQDLEEELIPTKILELEALITSLPCEI